MLVNPISGRRSGADAVDRFRAALEGSDLSCRVRPTQAAGDAALFAREEAERGTAIVVAAGGDGTVNEVASGLLEAPESPTALALLPRGTSNLVARHLGVPLVPEGAARALRDGTPTPMDVGIANGRVFLACVGVGWDAHVVERLSARRKGNIGFHSYAIPIVQAVRGYRQQPMRVETVDGDVAEGVLTLVLNTRPYAALFTPAPAASTRDGLLDVLVLRRGAILDLARWALRAVQGRLVDDHGATYLRTRSLRIEADAPLPFQRDGDVGGTTPVDILVRPGALRVIRPDTPKLAPPSPQEPG